MGCLKGASVDTLAACRETCSSFHYWTDNQASFWSKISLKRAMCQRNFPICRQIIQNVQDVNPPDKNGITPLHWTARWGLVEIVRLIIPKVQDKNPTNKDGITPLHLAADRGHVEICRVILENVQDKNPADDSGHTPLHWAAMMGNLEVCRVILENAQNKNPANHYGITPLDLASTHADVHQLIQSHLRL